MNNSKSHNRPKARSSELLTREIPGELLIYDMKRHTACCLNETAASIWKQCNGKRTVPEIARQLEKSRKAPLDEKIVWLAVDQLQKKHLLEPRFSVPPQRMISRRESIRTLGLATAVALPIVVSIIAPTAVSAVTAITPAVCATRRPNDLPGGTGCQATPCTSPPNTTCTPNSGNSPCSCK